MKINIGSIDLNDANFEWVAPEDIQNKQGALLVPAGRVIDKRDLDRLKIHGIGFINATKIDKASGAVVTNHEPEPVSKSLVHTQEFKEFSVDYKQKSDKTRNILNAIKNSHEMRVEEVAKITEALITDVAEKQNALSFLWFMQDFDDYTAFHSNNVAVLANTFGRWLKLGKNELETLTLAALLHDVGKLEIPAEIANKSSKLDEEEYEIMKTHPEHGYERLRLGDFPNEVMRVALLHHERIDGSGYPFGLGDGQIDRFAKIVAICDTYDAMSSRRPYKEQTDPFTVIRKFEREMLGILDTELLLIFLKNISQGYVGSWVSLSDGREAEVLIINSTNISKPVVRTADNEILILSDFDDLYIVTLLR